MFSKCESIQSLVGLLSPFPNKVQTIEAHNSFLVSPTLVVFFLSGSITCEVLLGLGVEKFKISEKDAVQSPKSVLTRDRRASGHSRSGTGGAERRPVGGFSFLTTTLFFFSSVSLVRSMTSWAAFLLLATAINALVSIFYINSKVKNLDSYPLETLKYKDQKQVTAG